MNGGFSLKNFKLISLLVFILIITGTLFSSAEIDCENVPDSSGPVPEDLIELCGNPEAAQGVVSLSLGASEAFGWEAVAVTLDSLFLDAPEILTEIGPLTSPSSEFIGGCEFDNSGNFDEIYCISQIGEFFTSNTTTGARTDIGTAAQFNGELFSGLATDPTSGIMYACSDNLDLDTSSIFTLDLATGAATRIGAVTNSSGGIISCAFDNFGQMYGLDITDETLIRIDKATGAGTVLGVLDFNANFGQGMDFNEIDNTCYLFAFNNDTFQAELRTCNTNDGSTSLIGVLGSTTPGGLRQISGAGITETFTLSPIIPGYQSSLNMMTANTATAQGPVAFIWGFMPGSTVIGGPRCNGTILGLNDPRLLKIINAGLDETAELIFYIPLNPIYQMPVLTQALDIDTCRITDVITNIILNN